MRINNNMAAVTTNNQLLNNENAVSKVMERLSSGLKINHAQDNPAGMAISSKMKAQIDGLNRAADNANDGTSVIQTADGALNEVTDMLQRMRELCVQAANGTNSQNDKEAIQAEIESLKQEVDRVSATTQFNNKNLLDGSMDARIYSNDCSRIQTSNYVPAGIYDMEIISAATQAKMTGGAITAPLPVDGSVSINGYSVQLTTEMSDVQIYEALRKGAEIGECEISKQGDPLEFTTTAYGAHANLELSFSSEDLANALGFTGLTVDPETKAAYGLEVGKDADVTLKTDGDSQFTEKATVKLEGNKMTITDTGRFEMSFLVDAGYTGTISHNVTEVGVMKFHIGSNEGQTMDVRIPSTDIDSLYIDSLDVTTVKGAERGMGQLDAAISRISDIRAQLGAYENRIEHTVNSLGETNENMTSAISRIQDADMATEMVDFTRLNVLTQAGTSALSQANELPQLALQLLQ